MTYNRLAPRVVQRAGQVRNNAGGYVYPLDKWQRLQRWLILGSDTGSYYVTNVDLTIENANIVLECLREEARRTCKIIEDISDAGRSFKNSAAIFAAALAMSPKLWGGDHAPYLDLTKVVRTGSHLLEFVSYVDKMRGWGTSLRDVINDWYLWKRTPQDLAYQVTKYYNRHEWTQRDVLRLAHPKTKDAALNEVLKYTVSQEKANHHWGNEYLNAVEWAKSTDDVGTLAALIHEHNLPWEVVQRNVHGLADNVEVKNMLLTHMPMMATIRNLGSYTADGILNNGSYGEEIVLGRLKNVEALRKARIHPMNIFIALLTYQMGRGVRGSKTWTPNRRIVQALEEAFYTTFGNVVSSGKRILVAVDRSGSMAHSMTKGVQMSAARAAMAQALVIANTEANADFVSFSTFVKPLVVHHNMSLNEAFNALTIEGGTNCGAPLEWAQKEGLVYDAFVILTDAESWHGVQPPYAAFNEYRETVNKDAKLITIGMCANGFTLGAPSDVAVLDCVGFDTNTPTVISAFLNDQV